MAKAQLNEEELEQVKETLQKEFIRQNTAKINVDRAMPYLMTDRGAVP